jgi:hydroxypyruvate isomerase
MSAIQQSVAWWCFVPGKLGPEQFVEAVAAAGYAGIDLVPPEHWSLVTSHGLRLSAVAGHASLTLGLNRREEHERIARELRANLELAQRFNIPTLICFSGNRRGLGDAEGAAATAAGLALVAAEAEAAGVTLALELLNSKVDHPDYQADRTAWGLEVCRQVGSPRVKLLYDIYHMQIMEGDVIRTIQAAHPQIAHYHTAGNPGRHDLDDTQELFYPAILGAIRATGYAGYLAHEFIPKGDPVAALHTTFALCALQL